MKNSLTVKPSVVNDSVGWRLRIALVGVGGQGILTAARVLGEAAMSSGLNVVIGEVHGMSQRGGVVETTVILGDARGPLIAAGGADMLIGFEPLETVRALPKTSRHTLVVMNSLPIAPSTVQSGRSSYPDLSALISQIECSVGSLMLIDAGDLARQAGGVIAANMVLLGALAAAARLPLPLESIRQAIAQLAPRHAEINRKAFMFGYDYALGLRRV
jgi:indolepyruvate ferredoxin oxidoreductase beta subunit